ncbi:MAG: GHKL domain-containing protein [Deltaproteobacteria bacterium]|nr:MAG: GHKL domain-containing protein [Deltaproteobacteria bacterium]
MRRNDRSTNPYYRSLIRNMVLIIILVSITPMLLVGGVFLDQFYHSYRNKIYDHLKELTQKHIQNIDGFLQEKLSDLRLMADTNSFDKLSDETFLAEILALLGHEYHAVFTDLGVINAQGRQIAYAGPFKLANVMYSESEWFKKAITSQYFISDVFLGLRGLPHFIIAVRQKWRGDYVILRATVDFAAFNNLVEKLRIGKTGFAFILNKNGELQTKPYFDFVPRKGCYGYFLDFEKKFPGQVQIVERSVETGNHKIYAASFLKNGDWLLVYQQDIDDAFSELNRTKNIAILIMITGSLVIIAVAFISSKKMVQRIEKADKEKELMNQQVIETGKLASIGELAAGIAHEINNPVAIMVEEAGWIRDLLEEEDFKEGENLDEFQRALNQIKTQGIRCKEITHKLLSFARKTDPKVHDVQINDLIEQMVELSAQKAKYSNVVVNTNLKKDLPPIQMPESELQQVFLNLLNNAIDAMEKTGGTIQITSHKENNNVLISVADNGPGIPRANLARIFDPFFSTKPVGKGTGLGLSICYGIIKKMGGSISVKSVIDVGTIFHVRIPIPDGQKRNNEVPPINSGSH